MNFVSTTVISLNQSVKIWSDDTHRPRQTPKAAVGNAFFSLYRPEYSDGGAVSFVTARSKHSKTAHSLHKEPAMPSRQFGRNAYV